MTITINSLGIMEPLSEPLTNMLKKDFYEWTTAVV